ncbi:type II secretion system F family protein [Dermatobacter hominis]|uniref:type II secretion system F family protein n=1 Tax=Dermatobacter hominis TaxID=2884263 RepID=UPI001D10B900|nr:type II secretion system F family protein [Dermatobacter hominis]UDY36072.1 type II secretion system F family protein [Dermatobacter hominis]
MSPILLLSVLLLAAAIGAAVWAVLSQLDERQVVRESLRQLDGYEVENQRDQEMLAPLKDRALGPLVDGVTDLGKRFTPVGYVEKVKQKLVYAGMPDQSAVDRFLGVRVIGIGIAALVFLLLFVINLLGLSGNMRLAVPGIIMLVLVLYPDMWLNRKVEARQHEIQITLPDVMDLLVISVEAGLGFEQAIDRVVNSVPGPLSDEFSRMLGETRAGASRSDAMRAMDDRCNVPELRSFVMAIIQADQFGVSIGRVLRAQADEMRIKRRQLAQERAQKAPVKMLIPMVFCIFPALFVVVIGPAIMNIRESL